MIVTLVVLIVSIRQNTQAQRVLAVESLAGAITAINLPGMESPELGSALSTATRNWNAATREQRIVAHYFLFSYFKLLETAWYQRKANSLDQSQWVGWEAMLLVYYHSPGIQEVWWPRRRGGFSPEFQAYLAGSKKPEGISPLGELFDAAASERQPNQAGET
ncbi:MAG: hypothetical protein AB7H66_17665 [Hyphomonadaceae bacterium]